MFDDPRLNQLYIDVPDAQIERLLAFRAAFPPQHMTLNGVDWEYIDGGSGYKTILFLPGALSLAEASWQSIEHFARSRRVIAPSYPPLKTMAELVDGIAALLDHLRVQQVDVVGGSYGGLVAQVLVRRHPQRVRRMALSHTGFPDRARGAALKKNLRLLRLMPWSMLKNIFKKRTEDLLPRDHPEAALSQAQYSELIDYRLNKAQLLNVYTRAADLDLNGQFTPTDLAGWPGRLLILLSEDDPTTPPEMRDALLGLYPQAEVHTFQGAGHDAPVTRRDEYHALIEKFLS